MFRRASLSLLACLLAAGTAAHASSFNFTATGAGFSASGILTGNVDPNDSHAYDITSATGVINGSHLTLETPGTTSGNHLTSADGRFYYNNVLYTTGAPLDYYGLLLTAGGVEYNLYDNPPLVELNYTASAGYGANNPITMTVSATPEPSSLVLLGTALVGSAGMLRKLRRA